MIASPTRAIDESFLMTSLTFYRFRRCRVSKHFNESYRRAPASQEVDVLIKMGARAARHGAGLTCDVLPSLRRRRYVHGRIFGPMPPSRSTLTRTIKRFSPGWRYGYLSTPRNRFASLSAWASAPASVTVAVPLRTR